MPPLEPVIPNPEYLAVPPELLEAQRLRDLNAEQRHRDVATTRLASEFAPFDLSRNDEQFTRAARRAARLAGDPVPPMGGELRHAE